MTYIFNAMTHLAIDVRLMAFKIFDLLVQHYPHSFFLYAEKVYWFLALMHFVMIFLSNIYFLILISYPYLICLLINFALSLIFSSFMYYVSLAIYFLQILQNYEDILRKNQYYLQDKGKLKVALSGLVRCLSMLPCNKREVHSCEKVPSNFQFLMFNLVCKSLLAF